MVKYLREVWQTSDGKVFGSEADAKYHEESVMKIAAVNAFRDQLKNWLEMYNNKCIRVPSASEIESLLKACGFTYTGKV